MLNNILNTVRTLGVGVLMTFNPDSGEGLTESIIAVMIVGATLYIFVSGQTVPQFLQDLMMLIAGTYFGFQVNKNVTNPVTGRRIKIK